MMMSEEEVLIPDDRAFSRFKHECQSEEDWSLTYNKNHICVWIQVLEEEKSLHRIKVSNAGLSWVLLVYSFMPTSDDQAYIKPDITVQI